MDILKTSCILFLIAYTKGIYAYFPQWTIECPPWNGELVFIADPTDCAKYYACTPSGPVHYDCPSELWWDSEDDICNWPDQVKCSGTF